MSILRAFSKNQKNTQFNKIQPTQSHYHFFRYCLFVQDQIEINHL